MVKNANFYILSRNTLLKNLRTWEKAAISLTSEELVIFLTLAGKTCILTDILKTQIYIKKLFLKYRFANAHTSSDLKQVKKEPASGYQPSKNYDTIGVQISLRKHKYDFTRSDEVGYYSL